ncbi:integrase [Bacillus thuringiensis]|nr:integrase [Bacillus thuringiensis]OUA63223.1 integrase [Bacillus thuringiensis serovar aizawai]PFH83792.1 integrase [Bacillus cereus]
MNEGISLEVALEAFSAYLEENGRKQSRIERYTYDIKGFLSD